VASRAEVDRQLSNLNQLAREVRLQPYFERGKLAGFLLSNIKAGSFIQRMGGRDGDVVKAVNGGAIDSVQKAFSLYNTFRTNGQVNINVMRGGQSHTIQYNIQ
jgi:type II secretory pathway component PulC